jgi:virginiamycin A acetyltransferase
MNGPDPDERHPMPGFPRVGFLRPFAADRPDVSVGRFTVAARAVVSGEVPPYAIVGGNPARAIRTRFDEETVAALLDIAWWVWPVERISANLDAIRGQDLAALRRAA